MTKLKELTEQIAQLEEQHARALRNLMQLKEEIEEAKKLATEIIETGDLVVIHERKLWRREMGKGYTLELIRAGLYPLKQAKQIAKEGKGIKLFNAITGQEC